MTVTAPPARQLVTNALLTMLRSAGVGLVGDNRAPKFGGSPPRVQPTNADYPYSILYDIEGGARSGDFVDDMQDAQFAYQWSFIGRRRDQAQLMADKGCAVLVGRTDGVYTVAMTDPAGMSIIRRTLDEPYGAQQQGTAEQLVWLVPCRFRLDVTAA